LSFCIALCCVDMSGGVCERASQPTPGYAEHLRHY